ncbi:hypothetical protein HOY80DRAFT_945362 [Tuber brumale]|nr:hypothetical protein HOY80DRAFT_945362 [Tuber brumale]
MKRKKKEGKEGKKKNRSIPSFDFPPSAVLCGPVPTPSASTAIRQDNINVLSEACPASCRPGLFLLFLFFVLPRYTTGRTVHSRSEAQASNAGATSAKVKASKGVSGDPCCDPFFFSFLFFSFLFFFLSLHARRRASKGSDQ